MEGNFKDEINIYVEGGRGGDGCVSFRREKFMPRGGPDGGDGGHGGSVYLRADEGLFSFVNLTQKSHYWAERGTHGKGASKTGKNGEDIYLDVPCGTMVYEKESGEFLGDLISHGDTLLVAKGGSGGRGNASYATSRRQAPRIRQLGEKGHSGWISLELKMIAEVGLIGFPNAGKSSLLARISGARPKVADYPFTTLTPNLGVADLENFKRMVVADIPGIIEGAHMGIGLGDKFLRHIERTRLLVFVIDLSAVSEDDPAYQYNALLSELENYNPELAGRPHIVIGNKIDLPGTEDKFSLLEKELKKKKVKIYPVSCLTGKGVEKAGKEIFKLLEKIPVKEAVTPPVKVKESGGFRIKKEGDAFRVRGKDIERLVAMTDKSLEEAVMLMQQQIGRMGIEKKLKEEGIREGDRVIIGDYELFYEDEEGEE
ncbi:MAG: GTPase ObgE [Chloroflexi bacterium]|nr:GTPase ObgE [Chloroflexota bacterium]